MTPDQLMQMIQGIEASAAMKAGLELGVFDAIAAGNDTVPDVAAAIRADKRGTRILLDALAAISVVEREDGRYRLAPVADEHLVAERPMYLGNSGRLFTSDHVWNLLRTLPDAVRNGGTVLESHAETPDHPFWAEFAAWTGEMAGAAGAAQAELLRPWASERERLEILDVACGTGVYGYTIATEQPQARVTSLDWPSVLDAARRYATSLGVLERTRFLPGDCFEVDLEGPYDLALTSHIFHHFDEARCEMLLGRIGESLVPGGRIAIHEFMPTDTPPAEDPAPHMFSALMLCWTREGEAHSLRGYERLLDAAGFAAPEVHPVPGTPSRFLFAEKRR